ncbi:MBL fold metallo-hydrolase [Fulvivirgaceae bacterium PWU4]|uniref:MBL fold metallo-hydrolase n=1 Tax=Chryseosolibacter histidini TaxID=2782349 RepID=A0AAP2DMU7_9BACT|nr:MBL fold metallo-hydrolase [Chryseosolibacter histidini]MBT1699270.1 MBL fold metallo-hydrolase [Chryseosolibacter histidini]
MDVKVKFLGATGTVTGSRFLLDIGGFRLLVDCGLFQGLKELRLRNWEPFPVKADSINAVVISHAHIDHTGYLPRLVKEGYKGPIYCTRPTADLMEIMLLDSAKLQEEEASFAYEKGYSKHANPQPLYTTQDAEAVFPLLKKYNYDESIRLADNIEIIYKDAGHLLGSAITELYIKGDSQSKKIVFSGDLGRNHDAMLRPPAMIESADILFVESTYGNKSNPAPDPEGDLERIVKETFARGGVVLIPAFAVGRTQVLLYYLHQLMETGKIPDVPVYIDSPMAISATYLYYRYPDYHKVKFNQSEFARKLETNMLLFVKTSKHSKALNEIKANAIIISSSGMMTGGRILHHLYHRLPNPQDTVVVAGYQAEGTRGRKLVDQEPTIRIFGEEVPVKCKVENMTSLSGHADKEELFLWMSHFKSAPKMVFPVHGEKSSLDAYAKGIKARFNWNVIQPAYLESVSLFRGI